MRVSPLFCAAQSISILILTTAFAISNPTDPTLQSFDAGSLSGADPAASPAPTSAPSPQSHNNQLYAQGDPLRVAPIPCVLVDNIKTGQLKQRVRALICQDVVFAYRIQVRAYSAMLLGEVASQPIGDTLDIHFDTIIFADGSELPISGTAYSPEDPRYPGEGNHRGIHGTLATPPLKPYVTIDRGYPLWVDLDHAGNNTQLEDIPIRSSGKQ